MNANTKNKIYLIYGAILSALLVATGVCMIISCVGIYQSGGDHPFTREVVEMAFGKIAILVYVTVGAVIVGGIMTWTLPRENAKVKGSVHPRTTIQRMWCRVDATACDDQRLAMMAKEVKLRRVLYVVATIFCVILAVPAVIYVCDLGHFTVKDKDSNVVSLMYWVLPAAALGLGGWVAVSLLTWQSWQRELALVKDAVKLCPATPAKKPPVAKENTKAVWIARGIVLAVAVIFVVLGVMNGGMADVLEKAIKICTECIGLG